ncbi:ROK family transcriptional regulator [Pseudarthrobacter sp. J1738]|uniref:ROK family transcriptional regulator n=1 Tax=Pseudarthrobacter sp. J1738 TaxID=3420446 RepID=UPI003D28AFA0
MGDFNLTVILDAIRRSTSGLSRVELAQIVGLSPQTISNISRRLLDQGLIVEAGKYGNGPGKPRTILRLNPAGMYAVGVHLDPAVTTCVLLDLVGNVVQQESFGTPDAGGPRAVVDSLAAAVTKLVSDSGVNAESIAGLGVSAPGPIDRDQGTVVDPPLLDGWNRVALRDAVAKATGMETILDKDVTGAAVAETWAGGDTGTGSFVFFYIGTGIGCSIVLEDEVVRGISGNAGEMGHIMVDPEGAECDCGLRGCVKVACIPPVMVAAAVAAGLVPDARQDESIGSGTCLQERFAALLDLADEGNDEALAIIDRSAVLISRAVSAITNVLDVERAVFGGPFWSRLAPYYLDRLPELVNTSSATRDIHEIEIASSGVGEDVGAVGAACLVLEHVLAPKAQRLLLQN